MALDTAKLAAARLWAVARMPYLATALFATQPVATPDTGTLAVDGRWRLQVDPEVLERLSVEETGRLILHLCGHLIRDHAGRARRIGVRDGHGGEHWNRCADAEINDDLADVELAPRHTATDRPHDLGQPEGRLAEAYWERAREGRRVWDCGAGADGAERGWDAGTAGDPAGPPGIDPGQVDLLRQQVAAELQAQPPGSVPGGWLRWAETVQPSGVDWRRVLAAELRSALSAAAGMVDYSYRRPSRRAQPGVVLPTLRRPMPEVAIVLDTSGSMHQELLERALAEVDGVLRRAGLRNGARVLAVDTDVQALRRVSSARQVELAGGGGTDMGEGIAAAAALRPAPSTIVVLTDGFTPWPDRAPRGTRVVVGILTQPGPPALTRHPPPAWARTVLIDDATSRSWNRSGSDA